MDQRQFSATMQGFNKMGQYGEQKSPQKRQRRQKLQKIPQGQKLEPGKPRNLSFVNLSNDEINFISGLKIDLIQLQESIDTLDIDGLLRNPKVNTFTKKNYVISMKKFLSKVAPMNALNELEARSSMDIDPKQILKLMNVNKYPEGLTKLYRIIGSLELMLLKYTEYEILSFLKYDDAFTSLVKKSNLQTPNVQNANQKLGIGINVQNFKVALSNLDRLSDLFTIASKVVSHRRPLGHKPSLKAPLNKIKPLQLNQLKSKNNVPKFKNLDDLEVFLKTTQQCSLEEKNLKNILAVVNYLKKKARQFRDKSEQIKRKTKKLSMVPKLKIPDDLQSETTEATRTQEQEIDLEEFALISQQPQKDIEKENILLSEKSDILTLDQKVWSISCKATKNDTGSKEDNDNSKKLFCEMLENYRNIYLQKLNPLEKEVCDSRLQIYNKTEENIVIKTKIENADKRIETLERQIRDFNKEFTQKNDKLIHEEILRQEFDKMQKSYQEKIKTYDQKLQQQRKEKAQKVRELKQELLDLESNKGFIVKKLNLYEKKKLKN